MLTGCKYDATVHVTHYCRIGVRQSWRTMPWIKSKARFDPPWPLLQWPSSLSSFFCSGELQPRSRIMHFVNNIALQSQIHILGTPNVPERLLSRRRFFRCCSVCVFCRGSFRDRKHDMVSNLFTLPYCVATCQEHRECQRLA